MANQASIMDALPTGTVTFLFTDIEGSTQRWERDPAAMREALRRHDAIVRAAVVEHGGHVFKATGDGFCAAFKTAGAAVNAASKSRQALASESWREVDGLIIRAAIHTGTADERDGDYFGPALNRVARLLDLARGGHILLSAATTLLVGDALHPDERLVYLGKYKLTNLSGSEAIHQLVFGEDIASLPLRQREEPSHNLPVPLTSYIESEHTVEEVMERTNESRLLTLCGAGGVGKTRTALEAAARMSSNWRDGEWFVQLDATSDRDGIVRAIASALSVRDVARRPTIETLLEHLAPRKLLLILDNCEQIVEAIAPLVHDILQKSQDVSILATSREPLRVAGERVFLIEPLSVPVADSERLPSLAELERSPAVKLFLDRARSVAPAFRFTDAHRAPVLNICTRLDGIPLALELAAARIGTFTPRTLADRLENRFTLLTRGARGSLTHHRTLHALVDWSWSLLDEDERTLFRRLAIFAGGWTIEGAEAVAGNAGLESARIVELLAGLCEKSLVQNDRGDVVRFRFLETIREFAIEKLDAAGERARLEREHATYFASLANEAEPHLRSAEQHVFVTAIRREVDNFRAAFDASEHNPDLRDAGLALCAGLWRYWLLIGAFAEGRRRLAPHARTTDGDADILVRVLGGSALLALNESNDTEFVAYARIAVDVSNRATDSWSVAFAAVCLCAALSIVPCARTGVDEAAVYERARRLAGDARDAWLLAYVEFCEALRASEVSDARGALTSAELSVLHSRNSGDRFLIYAIALYLANLLELDDPARAASLVIESTESLEPGNQAGLAACLECTVRLAVYVGRYSEAAHIMGTAAAFREAAAVPAWRCDPNEYRELLRSALGSDTFDAATRAGSRRSFAEATRAIRSFVAGANWNASSRSPQ